VAVQPLGTGGAAASLLFTRLPERLFAPLASANKQTYWGILCALYDRRFGPDAPLPPSHGFTTRDITHDIEAELVIHDSWIDEDGATPETPLNIRAVTIFNRLHDCGWLRLDRHGVDKRVSMTPTVNQFLGQLINFAETGPIYVAGKVRSIEANLKLVIMEDAGGDSLSEAADQARHLLEHIRNTGTNVRDLMTALGTEETTAQYVRGFFSGFIEQVFIGDYKELRTREHPLSRRPQILHWAEELHGSEQSRERLIAWYETKRFQGDRIRAERMFERDVQKLRDLQRIDEYLERLDDEIRRANRRALAYLDYRLRSLRPIDQVVDAAIARVMDCGEDIYDTPFGPGDMISPDSLAEPRRQEAREKAPQLRETIPTDEDIARSKLRALARNVRMVTPPKLVEFVARQLSGRPAIASEDIKLNSVADVRAYQTLLVLGAAMESGSYDLRKQASTMMRGFRVRRTGDKEMDNNWITGVPFRIESAKKSAPAKGGTT
jgi:hypothetical protein